MHISLVVPSGDAILSSVIGSYKALNLANQYLIQSGQREVPFFHVELVGLKTVTELYGGAFRIKPHKMIDENH
jgi:hypothetical protein